MCFLLKTGDKKMSLIQIPDGLGAPMYLESMEIIGVRDAGENSTWIFIRGEDKGWHVECPLDQVLMLIPKRRT